jgi:hypothetical protein
MEREQFTTNRDEEENSYAYESIEFQLPHISKTLNIRTVRSQVALLDSHVGEELWDAAKLFCSLLCNSYLSDDTIEYDKDEDEDGILKATDANSSNLVCGERLKGKKILELGAGVASLGMCAMALGAEEVLCTDYDKDVLKNLGFNLLSNLKAVYGENGSSFNDGSKEKLRSSKLDWRSFAASDIQSAEWINTDVEDHANDQEGRGFYPDIVLGSALVYSVEGALYCADTVRFFLVERGAKECWILQMSERPGFDRFLLRLEHWNLTYETIDISEDVFNCAERCMGKISSNIDEFKLYTIRKASS